MLPRIFEGRRTFILGGGPSLSQSTCDRLKGKAAIAINSTARFAPWADCLFFIDAGWARERRPLITRWPGLVVTTSKTVHRRLNRVNFFEARALISAGPLSAGHLALLAAVEMGARDIVLLGYDCRTVDGRSHNHEDYPAQWKDSLYTETLLPMWKGWGKRMESKGVKVQNATPDSAIDEFDRAELLGDILRPW